MPDTRTCQCALWAALAAIAWSGAALADVVVLKSGKKIEGAAEERGDSVVLRLERGSLTFSRDDVERVDRCPPPWDVYEEKARALKPDDAAGHLALAKWCQAGGLSQRGRKELELVIAADPNNAEARTLLGHRLVDGKWRSPEELAVPGPGPGPAPAPTPVPTPGPAPAPGPKPPAGPRVVPDGIYNGASRGYVDDVNVQVTVAGGKITEVKIAGHRENRALTSLTDVPPKIVQKQSTQVDATSRATITSKAVMRAAETALCSAAPIRLADVPDGTYTGSSKGRGFDVTAQVKVRGGKIESVTMVGNTDAPRLPAGVEAQKIIPQRIVEQQSTSVAPHPGAEPTSFAVMRAVQAALDSAVPRVLQPK
ncbi:MAG TPA: FMN-binding protein [Planctomycetota bacterium]|nr:FMN-binding protein [Planctomycetota bacterium]